MLIKRRPNFAFVRNHFRIVREELFDPQDRRLKMTNTIAREAELRRSVIDRLITASLSDSAPMREATRQRWRSLNTVRSDAQAMPAPSAGQG